jgi:aminoglycoside phosphotransferase
MSTEPLNAETLQQWQSELGDFVNRTRRRLDSLSKSIASHQAESQPVEDELDAETNAAEILDNTSAAESGETRIVETHGENCETDIDPLERLNAIKLRLAKQIENV